MSLAEQIKQRYRAADLPPVPVEAFGESLFIRHWSGRDYAEWRTLTIEKKDGESRIQFERYWAAAIVLCLVDAEGAFVFPPSGKDGRGRPFHTGADVDAVAELDSAELQRVYFLCNEVVGIDPDLVGQAEKNSANGHLSASLTGSPS